MENIITAQKEEFRKPIRKRNSALMINQPEAQQSAATRNSASTT
jgi:hypothetical protein